LKSPRSPTVRRQRPATDVARDISVPLASKSARNPASEGDLRRAVARAAFAVDYQPRHAMRTGAFIGAEALLRWTHRRPGRGGSGGGSPENDRVDSAIEIGGLACLEATAWPGSNHLLSIKVLTEQLRCDLLCLHVAEALALSGLPPERLELGLPEDVLLTVDDDALFAVAALRDLGVHLCLDEFGQNLTSLSALKRIPVTALKLDRAMIRHLSQDEDAVTVLRAVMQTASAFGLAVCADGIENERQRAILLNLGCEQGQGTLFSAALSPVEVAAHLQRGSLLALSAMV
jgi:EAL domain-containing protein (putative c-di-GMP-specific phosphodiesterase class I)